MTSRHQAPLLFLLLSCNALAHAMDLATIALRHRPAEEMAVLLRPLLDEGETIIPAASSLVIKANLAKIEELNALVQELDIRQHRLLISVAQGRGLTLEGLTAQLRLGIGQGHPDGPTAAAGGHVYHSESSAMDQQTQRVQTLDGQSAQIRFGALIPVPDGGIAYYQPGMPIIANQGIRYREVSTGFDVLPRLVGQRVILEVAPWSECMNRQGGGVLDMQRAETRLEARLGEWIEVGGQVQTQGLQAGPAGHHYATRSEANRIFIKVDDLDGPDARPTTQPN